ncbi:MAG: glucose 1-dehydrogenase, partial [Chloroflexi bacterium]|nr:glucose 1-dehydrogenase [Chloroflexota bacterium]
MRLEGKVAIITGGANGMGAEDSRLFAREGAKVVVADMRDEDGEAVVSQIAESGGTAIYVHMDVTNESDWQRLVDQTVDEFGKLDILVNNAGISSTAYSDPMDIEGWNHIMDVNSTGVFLGTRAVIPAMKESGGGSIVNISSIMGFVGGEGGHPAYHASKGAVRIFTKAIAVKYGPEGIRANSVHPGFMPPMTTSRPQQSSRDEQIRLTPLRRTGEVHEVANGGFFLASDEAPFITA